MLWALIAGISLFLLLVTLTGIYDRPQAVACTDTRTVYVEAKVQEDRRGRIVERDFLGCTFYWFNYPFR